MELSPEVKATIIESGEASVERWRMEAKRALRQAEDEGNKHARLAEVEPLAVETFASEARFAIWKMRAAYLSDAMVYAQHVVDAVRADEVPDEDDREQTADALVEDPMQQLVLAFLGAKRGLPKGLKEMLPTLREFPMALAHGDAGFISASSPEDAAQQILRAGGGGIAAEAESFLKDQGKGDGYL